MYSASKELLDSVITRRDFISRMTKAGMTVAGAAAIANSLGAPSAKAQTNLPAKPESSRVVENMTGGEVMAEFLLDWDIPYVFGLAGSEEVGFLDALVDRTELQYATCIHEHVAMAMADGYSRSTGRTSIVQLHSIAGAAYALGQIAGSFRDRIPVVIAVGRQATGYRGHDGFLEAANLHMLPKDYAQWTWDVMSAESIPEVLRRAFLLAEAPPGGPSFLTFSNDLWEVNVPRAEIAPRSRSLVETEVSPPDHHIEAIVTNLLNADLPVLLLGNECIRWEVSEEVASIAESVGALVMTSNKVPEVFPTTHPNYAGKFRDDQTLLKDIDCFWSIGAHMFKIAKQAKEPYLQPDTITMHTSLAEADVSRNYPVDVAAIASIKATTKAVAEKLKSRKLNSSSLRARRRWAIEYTAKRRAALIDQLEHEWSSTPISTPRLMSELNSVMDKSAYFVTEIVTSDSYVRRYIDIDHTQPIDQRRKNFDTTSGILGWGVSAAIGVKMGNPDKEVWALTGDGCFNFGSQALWSASRYDVPIGVVIFNNGQYQANRVNQARFGGVRMKATNKYIGVNLKHPDIDYVSMAKAYDIDGERVEDPEGIADALKRCQKVMQEGRPYVVDVRIATRFEGADMTYYDYFSIGKGLARQE